MYRRLSLKKGTLRLRVILGSSGEHANPEVLVRMIALQFLCWTIPASPLRMVTESKAQFELTFPLPRVAAWLLHSMRRLQRITRCGWLVPRILVLRDPDWCAAGRLTPLVFWLYQREVEYQERFVVAGEPVEERDNAPQPVRRVGAQPPSRAHLKLVEDKGDLPPRQRREFHREDIPWLEFGGVGDLRGDGEKTDPMIRPGPPSRRRPAPQRL